MTSLTKICIHWSAGANKPCATDLKAYHFLFDKDGNEYAGNYKPEDNLNCYDGKYAQHCGGGNTGCIGVSCCGMSGFDLKNKQTKYPITQKQVEAMCCKIAKLCNLYGIIVNEKNVFTHYEFGKRNRKTSSYGKIDFTYIPYLPNLSKESIGNYLRNKVQWYQIQLKKKGVK